MDNLDLIAALIACLGALTAYLKSHSENNKIREERAASKVSRDSELDLLKYQVNELKSSQSDLSSSIKELQNSIIGLQMSVNSLIIELKVRKSSDEVDHE